MATQADRDNVFALGLPAEVFKRAPRRVDDVVPASGTIILGSHGLSADRPVLLSVLSSSTLGAPAAAPPGGLSVGVTYYARPLTGDTFQLSAAPGGSPIAPFADAGAGVLGIVVESIRDLDAAVDAADQVIVEYGRAHKAPIQAPSLIRAYLAARIYVSSHAPLNPAYSAALEAPSWLRSLLDRLFTIYLQGAPIQGATDATPNIAEMGPVAVRLQPGDFDLPGPRGSDIA